MKLSANSVRVGIATAVILGTIAWLAFSGYGASKSYYVTITELGGMGDKAFTNQLRVEGFVVPGSIEQRGTDVTFQMNEFESHSPKVALGKILRVAYKGTEPPPDTFKDDSQALAQGSYGRDGVFHANVLQAKCASKYAPAGPNQPRSPKPTALPVKFTESSPASGAASMATSEPAA